MALRSLGSSLVAKATPGSASRDLLEAQIAKPAIPGKGEIGTTSRDLVSEPQITAASPGSEKIITGSSGIEGTSVLSPTEGQPQESLLAGGMGLPQGPGQSGTSNPAMFDGNASRVAASPSAGVGRTASFRSGSGQEGPVQAGGSILPEAASTNNVVQAQAAAPKETVGSFFPGVASLGNRAAAGGGDTTIPKNFGQAVVATLSPAGSKGEAWATNPAVTNSGQGSLSGALRSISNKVGSVGPGKTSAPLGEVFSNLLRSVSQGASNVKNSISSKLRSLFGR